MLGKLMFYSILSYCAMCIVCNPILIVSMVSTNSQGVVHSALVTQTGCQGEIHSSAHDEWFSLYVNI